MTFYRWHRTDAPAFTATNAWSGLWGSEFSEDGTRTLCPTCDGSGEGWRDCPTCRGDMDRMPGCDECEGAGVINRCEDCHGDGWRDCVRGYSCCASAAELIAYMREHAGEPRDDWGTVLAFEGEQTGTGYDGEPTVVPSRVIAEMAWSEFVKEYR